MILSLAIAAGLADRCAPRVAKATLLAVAYNESGFDTLAIGDNTTGRSLHPRSRLDAVSTAQTLIARGHNIDMGISQINFRTAPALGLTVFGAFDACQNLAAAGALMERNYRKVAGPGPSQRSVAAMLSMYNRGNSWRGFGNGYVDRVYRAAAIIVPQLGRTARVVVDPVTLRPVAGGADTMKARPAEPLSAPRAILPAAVRRLPTPPWVAFGNPADVMVFADASGGVEAHNRKENQQ